MSLEFYQNHLNYGERHKSRIKTFKRGITKKLAEMVEMYFNK